MRTVNSFFRGVFTVLVVLMFVSVFLEWADAGPRMFRAGKLADRMIVILYGHHKIHDRDAYTVGNNATLASGASMTLLINTPALPNRIHLLITARGSGEGNYQVYKDSTVSAVGTALEVNNRDMSCTRLCGVDITHTPTITDIGDEYEGYERHFGAGQQQGGESRASEEIILPPDSFVIVNGVSEAANNDFSMKLNLYVANGDAP